MHKKKLIEVALPLATINDASSYDKMPSIGAHPKGIHLWWARLPLPCARAVLFASLVDDPSESTHFASESIEVQNAERNRLFAVIEKLCQKKIGQEILAEAAEEIRRSCGEEIPTVTDPFCGGGSIPLEAIRLGLNAKGGDLNPIPVLLTRASTDILHRFIGRGAVNPSSTGLNKEAVSGLIEDINYYSERILEQAIERIGDLFPRKEVPREQGGGEAEVLTWIWARTVKCPNPACGGIMPLVTSFWLARRQAKRVWVNYEVDRSNKTPRLRFFVESGEGNAPPPSKIGRGSKFRCLCCGETAQDGYVKEEGRQGRIGFQLMAVVADTDKGRLYLAPDDAQERIAMAARSPWRPDQELDVDPRNLWCVQYGLTTFGDLFTERQLLSLVTFGDLIRESHKQILGDALTKGFIDDDVPLQDGGLNARAYADAIVTYMALTLDRLADFNCSLSTWVSSGEQQKHLFTRQAIPMVWDFCEANVLGKKAICWTKAIKLTTDAIGAMPLPANVNAEIEQQDAAKAEPIDNTLVSTDPPYYANISYSGLSDFFYVWLRRVLKDIYPTLFSTLLVPKTQELTAGTHRFAGNQDEAKKHFEGGFRNAFSLLKNHLDVRFPMTVYYAMRQEEEREEKGDSLGGKAVVSTGWETLLEALISTGFQITATWPVRASQQWRMVSMGTNALASYIVLACRSRSNEAPLATRREFLSALRGVLPGALVNLQHGSIAPVDLAQASIGPGMAVYSGYSKVIESDGSRMTVRTALALINKTLDEVLTEQEGEFDPDTRWAIAWFEQHGMDSGLYGVAETLSKAKDTSVSGLVAAGILEAKGGNVRLLRSDELPEDWNPATDKRPTVWEASHYLIRALDKQGEEGAAKLLRKLGGDYGERARDLAYRLYNICERKGWPLEGLAFNSLVITWPEITRLAHASTAQGFGSQTEMFETE